MTLKNFFKISYSKKELLIFKFLLKVPLFKGLENKQLMKVLQQLNLRFYSKNEVVFYQNDPSQALYIISEGAVCLERETESECEIINTLTETQCFGVECLNLNQVREFTALTKKEKTMLYIIPQSDLFQLIKQPEMRTVILENFEKYYNINIK